MHLTLMEAEQQRGGLVRYNADDVGGEMVRMGFEWFEHKSSGVALRERYGGGWPGVERELGECQARGSSADLE